MSTRSEPSPTRERILSAALEAFSSDGYAATSMRALADRVGLKAASIYAHFPSKEAILEALMDRAGPGSASGALREISAEKLPPGAFVQRYVAALCELWTTRDARLVRGMLARLPASLGADARYRQGVRELLDELAALFQRWQDDGRMVAAPDASYLAWSLMAPIGNLRTTFWSHDAVAADLDEGVALARAHAEHFTDMYLTGGGT